MSRESDIKKYVAAQFAEDKVREDEVFLEDNGDIVIDRRKTKPWAKPMTVGRWKK